MPAKNVDDLLLQPQNNDPVDVAIKSVDRQDEDKVDNKLDEVDKESHKVDKQEDSQPIESDYEDSQEDKAESSQDDEHDDYGNKVPKGRTYTEEEVNKMMRERVKRGHLSQEQQQEVKQAAQDFKPDESSQDDWQKQLDDFIDRRLESRDRDRQNREYQAREQQARAEFEDKFTTGMGKYKDFESVVKDKPITDAMVNATRGFKDPAAFIYAASKNHAKELDRIARIPDALQQAMEIGRLEEKMRKQKQSTRSARPIESDKGDVTDPKATSRHNIDDLIMKHARTKRR